MKTIPNTDGLVKYRAEHKPFKGGGRRGPNICTLHRQEKAAIINSKPSEPGPVRQQSESPVKAIVPAVKYAPTPKPRDNIPKKFFAEIQKIIEHHCVEAQPAVEGTSGIRIVHICGGFIGEMHFNDGSYGETALFETEEAARIDATWRSRAWHDEPELPELKKPLKKKTACNQESVPA